MISVSCTVMHASFDRKRRYAVSSLISALGEEAIRQNWLDFQVMGDMHGRGPWWNARRCWEHGQTTGATHHLILQDDVKVMNGFVVGIFDLIEAFPDDVMSLFCLQRKDFQDQTARWGIAEGVWGCAVLMPVKLVSEFLAWEKANIKPEFKHDDCRVSLWCVKTKRRVKVPFPNVVDHLPIQSVMRHSHFRPRVSPYFVDDETVSNINWNETENTVTSINSYTQYDKFLIGR